MPYFFAQLAETIEPTIPMTTSHILSLFNFSPLRFLAAHRIKRTRPTTNSAPKTKWSFMTRKYEDMRMGENSFALYIFFSQKLLYTSRMTDYTCSLDKLFSFFVLMTIFLLHFYGVKHDSFSHK
jgi:hypothetical protein